MPTTARKLPGDPLSKRLLRRDQGDVRVETSPRGIYGIRRWVHNLDIVDELGGHDGCVNALAWSHSGSMLASGSDDFRLILHSYQPGGSLSSFKKTYSIDTGHSQNIFSVKFMPKTNDSKVITAAGDYQIRIFDLERAARTSQQFLTEADANIRVFRSHSDRVKRLVTESSPDLFLSCSEDGDVRQWDLRQPNSAYPPQGRRGVSVPPPLISYGRHSIDLNTISCSASQPHYIALGGSHLHCFLHDRRMLGRDKLAERGASLRMPTDGSEPSEVLDDELSQATQCVQRFAPKGQKTMRSPDSGHITACKISDARPNELVVSWSCDHNYKFSITDSPDSRTAGEKKRSHIRPNGSGRAKLSSDRKRKRTRSERASGDTSEPGPSNNVALRIRYENGQSEAIALPDQTDSASPTTGPQGRDEGIVAHVARAVHEIRHRLIQLPDTPSPEGGIIQDLDKYADHFGVIMSMATTILPAMDHIMRDWAYPMDVDPAEMQRHITLRRLRDSSRRFVQAAGVLARVLGGQSRSTGPGEMAHAKQEMIANVRSSELERDIEDPHERFCYDFVKALCLWLSSGIGALAQGFSSSNPQRLNSRFPLPLEADSDSIHDRLIPYLQNCATDRPIRDADTTRFEVDSRRNIFPREHEAVSAIAASFRRPFSDLADAAAPQDLDSPPPIRRETALSFWGFKVARGLLMTASRRLTYSLVDVAFGESGLTPPEVAEQQKELERRTGDLDEDVTSDAEDDDADMLDIGAPLPAGASDAEDSDEDSDVNDSDEREDDSAEEEEEEEDTLATRRGIRYASIARARQSVHANTPVSRAIQSYKGAANVRTVKDVNYYGRNDEYVVAGSDCGHFFIWDAFSGQLLNILEGDGEVVNVVQGHPYEPLLAVSGIDHSIKIFGVDARMRRAARRGEGVHVLEGERERWSSIRMGGWRGRRALGRMRGGDWDGDEFGDEDAEDEDAEYARRGDVENVPSSSTRRRRDPGATLDSPSSSDLDLDLDLEPTTSSHTHPRTRRSRRNLDRNQNQGQGLPSRRRMHMESSIVRDNTEAITRNAHPPEMLTRADVFALAARLQIGNRAALMAMLGGDDGDEDGEGDGDGEARERDCAVQ